MDNPPEKKGSKIDKLVMGVIIGGAIGSVLGLTLAPKKGEETRRIIKEKGKELIEKGLEQGRKLQEHLKTNTPVSTKPYKMGFWRWLLFGRKRDRSESMRPIPNESSKSRRK